MSDKTRVLVACQDDAILIAIDGLGSMNNSMCIFNYIEAGIEGKVREICFDMTDLSSMDSTFMGTLLLINEKVRELDGELFLINASEDNQAKLRELGVANFIDVTRHAEIPDLEFAELPIDPNQDISKVRHILNAHERLIADDDENRKKFGKFIQMLQADLSKYE